MGVQFEEQAGKHAGPFLEITLTPALSRRTGRGGSRGNVLEAVSIITDVKRMIRLTVGLVFLLAAPLLAQQGHVAVRMVPNTKTLQAGQQGVLAVVMDVRAGFHAQSHRPLEESYIPTNVTLKSDANITFHEPVYPEGKIENYPKLGKLSVYSGQTIIYVPFEVKSDAKDGAVTIGAEVEYQACNDNVCFPPETAKVSFETSITPAARSVEPTEPELFKGWDPARFAAIAKPLAAPREKIVILGHELGEKSYLFAFAA